MRNFTIILILSSPLLATAESNKASERKVDALMLLNEVDRQIDVEEIKKIDAYIDSAQREQYSLFQTPEIEALTRNTMDFKDNSYELILEQPIKISDTSAIKELRSARKKLSNMQFLKILSDLKSDVIGAYLGFCESNQKTEVLKKIHEKISKVTRNVSRAAAIGGTSRLTALKASLLVEDLLNQISNLRSDQDSQLSIISQGAQIGDLTSDSLDCSTNIPIKNFSLTDLAQHQLLQSRLEIAEQNARASRGYQFSLQIGYEKGFEPNDKNVLIGLKFPLGRSSSAKSAYYERQADRLKIDLENKVTKTNLNSRLLTLTNQREVVSRRLSWLTSRLALSSSIARKAVSAYRSGSANFQSFKDSVQLDMDISLEFVETKYKLEKINLSIWALGGFSK